MALSFFMTHFIIWIISFLFFIPKKTDNEHYKVIIEENFPKYNFVCHANFIVFLILFYIYNSIEYNYIDSFNSSRYIVLTLIIATFIFIVSYLLFKSEIIEGANNLKYEKPLIFYVIIANIYSSSVLYSCAFIYFTNPLLDYKPREEYIVSIKNFNNYKKVVGRAKVTKYELFIEPPVLGLNKINVTRDLYYKIQVGSRLKLYVCKGLYGQRYIYKKMYLLSPSD